MTSDEIKRALGHGGTSEIARRTGRTSQHVGYVLRGDRRDRKVEVAVARMLRRRAAEVFPVGEVQSAVA